MKLITAAIFTFVSTFPLFAQVKPPTESAMDRFLRYVKIDTQSAEDQNTVPSTKKQFDLANLLAKELKDLGVQNVRVSEFAIVYGMVPGNLAGQFKGADDRVYRPYGHVAGGFGCECKSKHRQELPGRRYRSAER